MQPFAIVGCGRPSSIGGRRATTYVASAPSFRRVAESLIAIWYGGLATSRERSTCKRVGTRSVFVRGRKPGLVAFEVWARPACQRQSVTPVNRSHTHEPLTTALHE